MKKPAEQYLNIRLMNTYHYKVADMKQRHITALKLVGIYLASIIAIFTLAVGLAYIQTIFGLAVAMSVFILLSCFAVFGLASYLLR